MDGPGAGHAFDTNLSTLIAAQAPGMALGQAFYAAPEIFERDLDRIYLRHWLCAGHVSMVGKPGDYFLIEIAAESVIIVRGQDGQVRGLLNVCRHRGSQICAAPSGNARVFICPYHAWGYRLDGSLQAARHMAPGFDLAQHGLKTIQVRIVQGLILVCFADVPPALDAVEDLLQASYGPYDWTSARVAHRQTYAIEANWKLAVENYMECYHCAPAHPEYSATHALEQPLAKIEALTQRMHARADEAGVVIRTHDAWTKAAPGQEVIHCLRYPLYDGIATGSADGTLLAPLMGRMSAEDGGATSIHLGGASFLLAYADHGVIYRFFPRGVQTCAMELIWLVRGDAVAGVDYDLDRLIWLWTVTSEADKRITEANQRGVNSRYYRPGPFAPMEANEQRWVEWYLREIA